MRFPRIQRWLDTVHFPEPPQIEPKKRTWADYVKDCFAAFCKARVVNLLQLIEAVLK